MAKRGIVLTLGAGAIVALGVIGWGRPGTGGGAGSGRDPDGWKSVTVLAAPGAIRPGGVYPEPLQALADRLEIRLQPASRGRGTEVHARFRPGSGDDPERLRAALRNAKALVEAGVVQQADPVLHGYRKATPWSAVHDGLEARSKGTGLL